MAVGQGPCCCSSQVLTRDDVHWACDRPGTVFGMNSNDGCRQLGCLNSLGGVRGAIQNKDLFL